MQVDIRTKTAGDTVFYHWPKPYVPQPTFMGPFTIVRFLAANGESGDKVLLQGHDHDTRIVELGEDPIYGEPVFYDTRPATSE